jgi:hypothetical protein
MATLARPSPPGPGVASEARTRRPPGRRRVWHDALVAHPPAESSQFGLIIA